MKQHLDLTHEDLAIQAVLEFKDDHEMVEEALGRLAVFEKLDIDLLGRVRAGKRALAALRDGSVQDNTLQFLASWQIRIGQETMSILNANRPTLVAAQRLHQRETQGRILRENTQARFIALLPDDVQTLGDVLAADKAKRIQAAEILAEYGRNTNERD